MKKIVVIVGAFVVLLLIYWKVQKKPEHKAPPSQSVVATCQALTVVKPQPNETVTKDFEVKTIIDNTDPKCHWTVFEAQAGNIEIKDNNGQLVTNGVLKTTDNWMTNKPVTYTSDISLDANTKHGNLRIYIKEEKPNGNPGQTISLPITY